MNTTQEKLRIVLLGAVVAVAILCRGVLAVELNIDPVIQEQTEWCWAACSEMILKYYGVTKTQTEIVQWVYGSADNLTVPLYNTAEEKRGVNRVLDAYAGAEIGEQFFDDYVLLRSEIFDEIDKESPILIAGQIYWGTPAKYHLMVIIGYLDDSPTDPTIVFNDPTSDGTGGTHFYLLSDLEYVRDEWEWQQTLRLQKSGTGGPESMTRYTYRRLISPIRSPRPHGRTTVISTGRPARMHTLPTGSGNCPSTTPAANTWSARTRGRTIPL